jgi:hypothetical protein
MPTSPNPLTFGSVSKTTPFRASSTENNDMDTCAIVANTSVPHSQILH